MSSLHELGLATMLAALRIGLPTSLRRRGLRDLLEGLSTGVAWRTLEEERLRRAISVTEAVLFRLRLQQTCLYRSLARYAVLTRAGRSVRFVMGMRRAGDGEIEGHAWLEGDALGLEEAATEHGYKVVFAYP